MAERKRVYRDRDGIRRTMIWDDDEPDKVHVLTEQDIEPVLMSVKRDRELFRNDGDNKLTHRIPAIIWERAAHEGWDEADWRKWFNGEGRAFSVWGGRL